MWIVKYNGFMQVIEREFLTEERAIQWARQVGVFNVATISLRAER